MAPDPRVTEAIGLLESPLRLADVGCRWGFPDEWTRLGQRVELVGFDPDEAECDRLRSSWRGPGDASFIPLALGQRRETRTLFTTEVDACSSLYPPVDRIWEKVPQLVCVRPVGKREIPVVDLDSWCRETHSAPFDAMKLDVQGAELDVLRGATASLASVRAVALEVTFCEIYAGQPLFGEVDAFMRAAGFALWRLDNFVHYSREGDGPSPIVESVNYFDSVPTRVEVGGGQLFWAHASFIRNEALAESNAREALRDACAFAALGLADRAAVSLDLARSLGL